MISWEVDCKGSMAKINVKYRKNQLLFQAIEDAIYNLNKALARDTIDCDTFLKYVRIFAREQVHKF